MGETQESIQKSGCHDNDTRYIDHQILLFFHLFLNKPPNLEAIEVTLETVEELDAAPTAERIEARFMPLPLEEIAETKPLMMVGNKLLALLAAAEDNPNFPAT